VAERFPNGTFASGGANHRASCPQKAPRPVHRLSTGCPQVAHRLPTGYTCVTHRLPTGIRTGYAQAYAQVTHRLVCPWVMGVRWGILLGRKGRAGTAQPPCATHACVRVRACACVCVRVRACACVRSSSRDVRVRVRVWLPYGGIRSRAYDRGHTIEG